MKTRSPSRRAWARACGFPYSATTTSALATRGALPASRTTSRIGWPSRSSLRATSPPTRPVDPVTTIIDGKIRFGVSPLATELLGQVDEVPRLHVCRRVWQQLGLSAWALLERSLDEGGSHPCLLSRAQVGLVGGHHHHLAGLEAKGGGGAEVDLRIRFVVPEVLRGKEPLEGQCSKRHQRGLLGAVAVREGGHCKSAAEALQPRHRVRPRWQSLPRARELFPCAGIDRVQSKSREHLVE